jgi:hypothetical protein
MELQLLVMERPMPRNLLRCQLSHPLAVVIVFLSASPALAARLLHVYIEQDGKVVAHTYYDDGGRADAATVWRYLKNPPIMVEEEATSISADANDPLRGVLAGDVTIRIQHVDRVIAQARLSTLTLHRLDEGTPAWFLPESEVERTAAVAGLGPPKTGRGRLMAIVGLLVLIVLAVLMTVGIVVSMLFLRLRRPRPTGPNET